MPKTQIFQPIGSRRPADIAEIMAFFIKKIAEIFDQAGIGYAVNQHTIGFGHQFGAGFGKRRQLAAQDIQRPNKQKIKSQHCQGQRNINVENKGKTDDNGNRRRNEPPENVVINAVTVIDNGFDFPEILPAISSAKNAVECRCA